MRFKPLFFFLFLIITINGYSQLNDLYNYDPSISVGYGNSVYPIIWELEYKPKRFNKILSVDALVGWQIIQGAALSLGTSFFPFKTWRVEPYFGLDYTWISGGGIQASYMNYNYWLKPDNYIMPFVAIKIKPGKESEFYLRIKAGYAELLNRPIIIQVAGTPDIYNQLEQEVKSNFFFSFGVGCPFPWHN